MRKFFRGKRFSAVSTRNCFTEFAAARRHKFCQTTRKKSYFRNRKFGFVPFVSTLRNLERVRVATGHFTIYSFLEGKVKILAKVGRQRFVAYGWRPLGGCRAPPKKSFFKKIGVNFFSLTSSDVGWGSDKSVTCFTLSVPLILSVSQSGEIH